MNMNGYERLNRKWQIAIVIFMRKNTINNHVLHELNLLKSIVRLKYFLLYYFTNLCISKIY